MLDFTRDDASWGLKAVDLTKNENLWAQISVLTESLDISVQCLKVVAKLYYSPVYYFSKF